MNGIHDLGGMDGFGAVEPEPDEPVFHHPWEGRVFALRAALRPKDRAPGWGSFRYDLERIPPPSTCACRTTSAGSRYR